MDDRLAGKAVRRGAGLALLSFALLGSAVSGFGQVSVFAANEVRAAGVKDRLRSIEAALSDGSGDAVRLSTAIVDAFKGADDWAPAAEEYYARKGDLTARASALEAKLDAAVAANSPELAERVERSLDEICRKDEMLRGDYEFYVKLPRLAEGPQRHAAQAAMRLLGKTGDYPSSRAYFIDKTPRRAPFAAIAPK